MKERFINLAIQQAKQSNMSNRLGAVVVKKKTVLGAGCNRKDHPHLYFKNSRTRLFVPRLHNNMGLHAEVSALIGLTPEITNDSIIYVVRLLKNDRLAISKPCESCRWYIKNMGVKRVIFSTDEETFGVLKP